MSNDRGPNLSSFAGRSIAVVGAGSGIGRACAVHLASVGASVACLDLDSNGSEQTAAEISGDGGVGWAGTIDVTQADSVTQVMADTISTFGVLDGLLNTAGITGVTNILTHEVDIDDFDRVYQVNVKGALLITQAVIPHMLEQGYGRILHIASIAGKEGNPRMVPYSATKAAVIGLTKSVGKELAGTGIRVNCVAPAVVKTRILEQLTPEQVEYLVERIPMGRTGEVEEVASLVAWLASSECSFSTGAVFDISGGRATY